MTNKIYHPMNFHSPHFKGTFEDDVPFPQVGYVSSLEASLDIWTALLDLRYSMLIVPHPGAKNVTVSPPYPSAPQFCISRTSGVAKKTFQSCGFKAVGINLNMLQRCTTILLDMVKCQIKSMSTNS